MPRKPGSLILLWLALLLTGSVATPIAANPAATPGAAAPAAKPAPEDPEVRMGRETHEELLKSGIKIIKDPKVVERVERIGQKLAAEANAEPIPALYGNNVSGNYTYRFFVVDDKDINAFSLPGGYIYVNKGLLDYVQSDDELAGVLAHEILHAAHHHVAMLQRQQSRLNTQLAIGLLAAIVARIPTEDTYNLMTGFQLLAVQKLSGHGQNAERDADHGGVIIMKRAGFNPVGALTFMERLARDEKARREVDLGIFRTHPPSRERANSMIAQIKDMDLPINRRAVTNAVKATTRTAESAPGATELLLDGKVMLVTASAERADRSAAAINQLLDENLQIYDVRKDGTAVVARGQTLVAVEPADVALADAASAEALADQAYRMLRNALYRQILEGAY